MTLAAVLAGLMVGATAVAQESRQAATGAVVVPLDTFPADARAAIEPAARAAAASPRDPDAAGRLAMALHAWEQWEEAHAAYARAQRLAPEASDWRYLDAVVLGRIGRPVEAGRQLEAVLASHPEDLAARARLAEALFDAGEAARSQPLYRSLADDPRAEPIGHFGLARIAARDGRHAEALSHFDRALALFPEFGPAHYGRAMSLRAVGRRDDAREALARHQAVGPRWPAIEDPRLTRVAAFKEDAGALVKRGVQRADAGDLAAAIEAHEAAVARSPDAVQARANLITLYGRTRQWDKAEVHYRRVVAAGLHLDEAHYAWGVIQLARERWPDAAEAFRLAIAVNPADAQARVNLGQLLERDRKLVEAADEYRRAVEAQPGLPLARFHLGRMLIALERADDAFTALEPLRGAPPGDETPRYLFALATAYVRARRPAEALRVGEEALAAARARGQSELAAAIDRDLGRLRAGLGPG